MRFARLLAGFFGCGRVPVSPGSAGSFAALLIGYFLLLLPTYALTLAILVATLGGLWAIRAARVQGDPGWVVIDEVAGQWIALLGLSPTSTGRPSIPGLLAAFLVFRILDIAKPGPVGWADRQKNAAGIMADDLIAGAIAAGIVWAVQSRWPTLFG
jgi:phosphatidylglycerophosphatase A